MNSQACFSNGNTYTKTDTYITLLKCARKLTNIDVHYCNGTKYVENEHSYNVAVQKVYQVINDTLKDTGITYYHQSDPRGASLYVGIGKIDQTNYNNYLAIY